jgi:hypothetical protein
VLLLVVTVELLLGGERLAALLAAELVLGNHRSASYRVGSVQPHGTGDCVADLSQAMAGCVTAHRKITW